MNGNRIGLGEVVKTWLGHQIAPYMRYLGKNERPNRLLDKIEQAAASLNRKDIDSWVKARQRALNVEAPRRDLLIKLFEDVKLDPHISGVIEHGRVNRLLAMDFRVLDAKSGKDEEELTQLLNSSWFHQFIKLSLESIWFGHSLIEFDTIEADRVVGLNVIPRAHIVPEFGVYLEKPSDSEGIAYRDTPLMDYMVEIGESHDLGVLLKAAPWYLYKKNATIAWSEFTELFGMPMRIGKTNTKQKGALDRMETMLRQMGSAAYGVFQHDEEIEFIESKRGDAFNVYDKLLERSNSELSKLFLGQTMTTEVGKNGSRSQGEVHERVGNDVTLADKRFIESVVNDKLFPLLQKHGWKVEGKRFKYPETKDTDRLWKRVEASLPHLMMDVKWIHEKFGIKAVEQKLTKNDVESGKKPKSELSNQLIKDVEELYYGHFHEE